MGILDSNIFRVLPKTGLEGTNFEQIASSDGFDVFVWQASNDGRDKLCLTFRDIYAWLGGTSLYLVKGKITDTPTEIAINSDNFPGLRMNSQTNKYPTIHHVIACPCTFAYNSSRYGNVSNISSSGVRVNVIFDNGQIYHNFPSCNDTHDYYNDVWKTQSMKRDPADFFRFVESVVWDLPNRKHPVKTKTGDDATLIATGAYYYNPALDEKCYEFHPALNQSNGYGNTVGFGATTNVNPISSGKDIGIRSRFWRTDMEDTNANSFKFMGGYITDNKFTMVGTYRSNQGANPCRMCVFGTQDGGRNWFCMYEFAGKDRLHTETYVSAENGRGVPLKLVGTASSGLYKVKRRIINVPYAEAKEPQTIFDYEAAKDVSAINGTSDSIIFTVPSHGLSSGDCIVVEYQTGVSDGNRTFDWMVNPTADSNSGGNGVLFKVTKITDDTFQVTLYIWNPDGDLPIRHIHALNLCKDGVSVSCGEAYPQGGWILYNAINRADAFSAYNVADITENQFLRLNSTKLSFQRPLGTIVREEEDGTYCYIGMDEGSVAAREDDLSEGRTAKLKHSSTGVYKVPISGIDNLAENGVLLYGTPETCFGFQQVNNILVFVGQYGEIAMSYDWGKSWTTFRSTRGTGQNFCNFGGLTNDRMFSVNNMLVRLKR